MHADVIQGKTHIHGRGLGSGSAMSLRHTVGGRKQSYIGGKSGAQRAMPATLAIGFKRNMHVLMHTRLRREAEMTLDFWNPWWGG